MVRHLQALFIVVFLFGASFVGLTQVVTINAIPSSTTSLSGLGVQNHHVSENLYRNAEIGNTAFTTTPIGQLAFIVSSVGAPSSFTNVKISLKNEPATTNVLAASTVGAITGYTQVFNGTINASLTGFAYAVFSTPFTRVAGTNLMVLIERSDNISHPGFLYVASLDNPTGTSTNTVRRFNGSTAPTSSSALSVSTFRPAIQLLGPAATTDAQLRLLVNPTPITCYDGPQPVSLVVRNAGTNTIAAGAATVSLSTGSPNAAFYTQTIANAIAPGGLATVNFSVNFNGTGTTLDTALVQLAGDASALNDTLFGQVITAANLTVSNATPIVEDAEGPFPLINFTSPVVGSYSLWDLWTGPPELKTPDYTVSVTPHSGNNFFYFDSWSRVGETGFVSRLFSNCVSLVGAGTSGCSADLNFWMIQENSFPADLDSVYVTVSTNKGQTWTRLVGFGRYNAANSEPTWKNEVVSLSAYKGQTIQVGFEGVHKFGNFIIIDDITVSTNCLLPITIAQFAGQRVAQTNVLQWSTSAESNNRGFELQRSADGQAFSTLAQVATKAPGGNSTSRLEYSYTDSKPLKAGNHYRLKQTDKDGRTAFSTVVYLRGDPAAGLQFTNLYPNPAGNRVFASIAAPRNTTVTFVVSNAQGKILLRQVATVSAGNNTVPIAIGSLAPGSYMVKATCAEGCETSVQKFVKQ